MLLGSLSMESLKRRCLYHPIWHCFLQSSDARPRTFTIKGSTAVSVGGVSRVRGATVGFSEAWLGRSMVGKMNAALAV
jgi:hypothetical protein